jgi:transposase
LSTEIHALVDALGNPLAFLLTPGQAHDLEGADALLPQMQAEALLPTRPSTPINGSSRPCRRPGKPW